MSFSYLANWSANEWQFFAEGNANVLFIYDGRIGNMKGKLLRIRKRSEAEDYISTLNLYKFMKEKCEALLPLLIVPHELVRLDPNFLRQLRHKHSDVELDEPFGLLVSNVACGPYEKQTLSKHSSLYVIKPNNDTGKIASVILELKPKWLQYANSLYCRTCLVCQLRGYERHFCPLDLISPGRIDHAVVDILSRVDRRFQESSQIPLSSLLRAYLMETNNVFRRLFEIQQIRHNADLLENVRSKDDVLDHLLMLMTLRDVGVFLKFEEYNNREIKSANEFTFMVADTNYHVKAYIYDLDLKSKLKVDHWRNTEMRISKIKNRTNPLWRHCARD